MTTRGPGPGLCPGLKFSPFVGVRKNWKYNAMFIFHLSVKMLLQLANVLTATFLNIGNKNAAYYVQEEFFILQEKICQIAAQQFVFIPTACRSFLFLLP